MKIPEIAAVDILTAVVWNRETNKFVREKGEDVYEEEDEINVVYRLDIAFEAKAALEGKFPDLRGKLEILPVTGGVTFVETASRLSPVLRDRMTRPFTG